MKPEKPLRNCLLAILLGMPIMLTGCAITMKEAMTKVNVIRAECDAKLNSGVYKNFYERTKCFNDGLTNIYIDNNYPYMDLVFLANAYRLAVAERYDKKEITMTEAEVTMAELGQRIAAEEQKRTTNATYARAAAAQGTGALLQGLGALNQSTQPLPRQPITCTRTGNVVNCF